MYIFLLGSVPLEYKLFSKDVQLSLYLVFFCSVIQTRCLSRNEAIVFLLDLEPTEYKGDIT